MRPRATLSIIVFAVTAAAVVIGARQTRDAGVPSPPIIVPSGTAVLSGTLMTDTATPRPVRRATVRLSGAAGTSARLVGTDDEGRFVFEALPAGSFSLSATKVGYVPAFHGAKRPGRGPGVPVAIADGQRVAVTFKMLPAAVITGTIVDPRGNPVPAVSVAAVEIRPTGASTVPPARVISDDRGIYRIFGLAPGDYVVSALPSIGTGRSSVPMTDLVVATDGEVQWARGMSAAGGFGAAPGGGPIPPPVGRPVSYVPVYYPGTADASAATKVSVTAGEERTDVGFSLQIVSAAKIAGTLVDQDGQSVTSASVSLHPRRRGQSSVSDALVSSGVLVLPRAVVSAPAFSIVGVAPGDYTLVARTGSAERGPAAAAASAAPPLWSVTDLTVDGQDQTNLVLRLQPGTKISGSIAFERSSLARPDVGGLDLSLVAASVLVGAPAAPRAVVDPVGAFRFSSVVPGIYALKAMPPLAPTGARWTLKSAVLNGRDVADVPLDVKPGEDVTGMVITFTDRESEIAGTFVDASGRPITRYSIVVFTVDHSLWLPNARRIRSTTPATDGTFSITGLPAGDYGIAAAEDVEASDLADPAFLTQLLAAAYRVTLAEGEKKTQTLRVGG